MLVIIAGTMAIIYFLPRFTKIVPSTLAAIIIGSDEDTNNINAEFKKQLRDYFYSKAN
jgi:hypothetical protein